MTKPISAKNANGIIGLPVIQPVTGPISAQFGEVNPKIWKTFHKGIDFAVPVGKDVACVFGGTVQMAGWHQNFGHRVWVLSQHPILGQFRHLYAHCAIVYVRPGQKILQSQIIALSGDTGYTIDSKNIGPHLHFQLELWPSRKLIKPIFL